METDTSLKAGSIHITYYTDPLCCWSWAFEPQWQQLLTEFKNDITYRYCMAGLLPDWKNYYDELFTVTRPAQMGPLWMHVSKASGQYMYDRIWIDDPPASSYPGCVAVKCAQLQSFEAGEIYLANLRLAAMTKGLNIAKAEALIKTAQQIEAAGFGLDAKRFTENLYNGRGLDLFKQDIQEVQYKKITRYPSLLITGKNKQAVLFSGYKPYSALKDVMKSML